MGSGHMGYVDDAGKVVPAKFDRGPCTRQCMRCKARAALDADGIEYVKDDSWGPVMTWNALGGGITACKAAEGSIQHLMLDPNSVPMMGLGGACAGSSFMPGVVTVVTGAFYPGR